MDRRSDEHADPVPGVWATSVPGTLDSVLKAAATKPGPDPAGVCDLADEDLDRFHQLIDE